MAKFLSSIRNLNKLNESFFKDNDDILKNIHKNYINDIIKSQEDLLLKISKDYNLEYEELTNKYMKDFKKNIKKNKLINIDFEQEYNDDNLLNVKNAVYEKILINDNEYYLDNENNIYNSLIMIVGKKNDNNYIIY